VGHPYKVTPPTLKHRFEDLPTILPIFPLTGVLLLPGSRLPLNIFEPRYLQMVLWALAHDRLIGMIQPKQSSVIGESELYKTGCAGRIISYQETEDGRLLIVLEGATRFDISAEEAMVDGFRRVQPDWSIYSADMDSDATTEQRVKLLELVPRFFDAKGISADWELVASSSDRELVNTLALFCPFDPSEKQALLEADTVDSRAKLLTTMMEMAMQEQEGQSRSKH
jgi:uncharacterized protein